MIRTSMSSSRLLRPSALALGEEFGMEPGTIVTGKMAASLRQLGFAKVFDTDFAADLTIIEEASEPHPPSAAWRHPADPHQLLARPGSSSSNNQVPGSARHPVRPANPRTKCSAPLPKLTTPRSSTSIPAKMVVVSVMPCVSKKNEAARPELSGDRLKNVDYVLSTRELAMMIKETGIDFTSLPDEDFDHPLGESTGAAVIFRRNRRCYRSCCAYCL